jgi:hypothetical protein
MDNNKKIVKALLEKNYVDAKESVFKSLYAKASLLMDEERVQIASALFGEAKGEAKVEETKEDDKAPATKVAKKGTKSPAKGPVGAAVESDGY